MTEPVTKLPAPVESKIFASVVRSSKAGPVRVDEGDPVGSLRKREDKCREKGDFTEAGSFATGSYHFIGLGGIGMSALARILLQKGCEVKGSDLAKTALLEKLENEGARVYIGQSEEQVFESDTIIYNSDIPLENPELKRAHELKLPLLHRSDLLHQLMKTQKPLLVTGTHGKTSTTSLLIHTLMEAGFDPSFVVGGILQGLQTNGRAGKGEYFVAEADESDGSFLKTASFGAIVTNCEKEHLSYWKTEENLFEGFKRFFGQVEKHLFWCADDEGLCRLHPPGSSYGFSKAATWRIEQFKETDTGICFDLNHYFAIDLKLFGRHNALNGAAVFALALTLGASEEAIRRAFSTFTGVGRRLENLGMTHGILFYDDYGHHPTEIKATLSALKNRIGKGRLVVLFQPHRYSRIKDLFKDFFTCFGDADELIMTDIYGATEKPIEGITGLALYEGLKSAKTHFIRREYLEDFAAAFIRPGDVVITLGAGDITYMGRRLFARLQQEGLQ